MAASQARLLAITARIHDVEYQSQAIQNAKVQLSTQSDQVYQEYLDALSATTLTMESIDPASGEKSTMTATFNNMCSINKLTPASGNANYALVNNKGQLILPDDVLEGYLNYKEEIGSGNGNAYEFAMFMLGESAGLIQGLGNWDTGDATEALQEYENKMYEEKGIENSTIKGLHEQLQSLVGEGNSIYDTTQIQDDKEAMSEYNETMQAYRKAIYDNYANDMYKQIQIDDGVEKTEDINQEEFNYYVDIYNKIQACSGNICSIEDYNGSSGDAANDSDWLKNMVESGLIRIENCTTDDKTGAITMDTVNPSSDTNLNYTETTSIDKTALAKAEAEYEHSLSKIDKKDKQYDMTLSKLESERTALTTEYDSVKKVIEDNIERTFGIFS